MKAIRTFFLLALLCAVGSSLFYPSPAVAETLTDRCSGKVRIPPHYGDAWDAPGTVELKRGKSGYSTPSPALSLTLAQSDCCSNNPFKVTFGGNCHKFQWYCQSKGSTEWTAEQSRCNNNSTRISASLGPHRLLQFQCLGGGAPASCPAENGGGGGTGSPVTATPGGACGLHDYCLKGGVCNLDTHLCERVAISGCGTLGQSCCQANNGDPVGCGGVGQCSAGTCQRCGGLGEECCGPATDRSCASGLTCGGAYCQKSGCAQ